MRITAFEKLKMTLRRFAEDDRGSALPMVIIMASIVLVLGAAVMATSYQDYRTVITGQISDKNFYDAESAVNEIREGIRAESEDAVNKAMEYTELYYANTPTAARTALMKRKFIEFMSKKILEDFDTNTDDYTRSTLEEPTDNERIYSGKYVMTDTSNVNTNRFTNLMAYVSEEEKAHITLGSKITVACDASTSDKEYYVEMEELTVTYTSDDGYEDTIVTSIRLEPPSKYYSAQATLEEGVTDTYGIIADGVIESKGTGAVIEGDVYAGDGIIAGNKCDITITADKVISREDLTAEDSGNVTIKTKENSESRCQLWVKNIITRMSDAVKAASTGTGYNSSSTGSAISIAADCYVADDLIMDDPGYDVTIDGNYYGYHTGYNNGGSGEQYDGSAVAVNAAGADLSLAEKHTLWLAGTNKLIVGGDDDEDDSDTVEKVDEGESLTYKWTQDAYLIPGSCIEGYEGSGLKASASNPMPLSEYNELTSNGAIQLSLNFSSYPFVSDINIESYLDPEEPYTAKTVYLYTGEDGKATNPVVYIYMNFYDNSSAAEYFAAYAANLTQRSQLTAMADILGYGSVKLNSNSIKNSLDNVFVGNLVSYTAPATASGRKDSNTSYTKSDDTDPFRNTIISNSEATVSSTATSSGAMTTSSGSVSGSMEVHEANASNTDSTVINRESRLTSQYNGLISVLNESANTGYPEYETAENVIDQQGLEKEVLYVNGVPQTIDVGADVISITKDTEGLLVTDRDVVISGCTFYGSIITTGSIILNNSGEIISDKEKAKYPENDDVTDSGSDLNTLAVVTYRNWNRNPKG